MADRARKALFALVALPALLRAALRLRRLDRHHGLAELAERMARVPPWRLAVLANPRYLEACARRVAGRLPPRRIGPCLECSLLLLDLWSRCGLHPRIHLGVASSAAGGRSFHAWVSLPAGEAAAALPQLQRAELQHAEQGRPEQRHAEPPHLELWSYSATR